MTSKRKQVNFYRSYFEVYQKLPTDREKVQFIDAILNKLFFNTEPELDGLVELLYISQRHSLQSSVNGWEHKVGESLTPNLPPTEGGIQGPPVPPSVQSSKEQSSKEQSSKEQSSKEQSSETKIFRVDEFTTSEILQQKLNSGFLIYFNDELQSPEVVMKQIEFLKSNKL